MAASGTPRHEYWRQVYRGLLTVMDRSAPGRACHALFRMAGDLQVFCRIDYHLATPAVAALARRESIYLDQRFSDHAPLTIDYDFTL